MSLFDIFINQEEKRLRGLFRIIITTPVVFLAYTIAEKATNPINDEYTYTLANELLTVLLVTGILVFAIVYIDKRTLKSIGVAYSKSWSKHFGVGTLIGVSAILINYFVLYVFGYVKITDYFFSSTNFNFWLELLGRGLGFLAVSISEELLLRGYLLVNISDGIQGKYFPNRSSVIVGLVISSIVFGLLHAFNSSASVISTTNLVFIALLFGYSYIATGSIAMPVGLHFAWNFTQAQILGLNVSGYKPLVSFVKSTYSGNSEITGAGFGPEGGILILISVLFGLIWIFLNSYGYNSKNIDNFVKSISFNKRNQN